MTRKRSAHLTRVLIEGLFTFSEYRGGQLNYVREYTTDPQINVDMITKIDLVRAIKILYERKELSQQELLMLNYVSLDGRLSRRDISQMHLEQTGEFIDQRTVSRRLETAYYKIARFLGWEYQDNRMFQIIAKKMGKPEPYILEDHEINEILQKWERV